MLFEDDMNMTPRYKFEMLDSGDNVEMGMSPATWGDLADKFYDFLLGCGFVLGKQDLSDHYDQSCFQRDQQSEADCDQFYLEKQVDEVIEEHGDALDKLDDGPQFPARDPEENHAERYGMQGPEEDTVKLVTIGPRKLYEFTVSDALVQGYGMSRIWDCAMRSAYEQLDLERSGEPAYDWPEWRLAMVGYKSHSTEDTNRVYYFEVWSI